MKTRTLTLPALLLSALAVPAFAEDQPAAADEPTKTLAEQLEETNKKSVDRLPEATRMKFKQAIDEVRESKIEKTAKQVGDQAPDGTLAGWDGEEVTLSELWKEQPIVLMWYRGGWCPYCNLQLKAMEESLGELEGAGARLVVLSPELPENAKQTAEANELTFKVLHDSQSELAHKYGIVFPLSDLITGIYRDRLKLPAVNGYDTMELPLAATYIVDRQGVIRYAFLDADYKKRAEPAEIIKAVKTLDNE
nr:peroxiredoxin-like family protein [Aeoliella mucimassa]